MRINLYTLILLNSIFIVVPAYSQATTNNISSAEFTKSQADKQLRNANLDSAVYYYKHAIKAISPNDDPYLLAKIHNNMGIAYTKKREIVAGIDEFETALEIYSELGNDTLLAQAYLNLAVMYKKSSANDQAMDYLLKCIQLSQQLGLQKELGASYNSLGNIYLDLGNKSQALNYIKKGLEQRKQIGHDFGIAGSLNSLSIYHEATGNIDSALYFAHEALIIKESISKPLYTSSTYTQIGTLHTKLRQFDSARTYINHSIFIRQQHGSKPGLAVNYTVLANIFSKQEQLDSAKFYLSQALELLNQEKDLQETQDVFELLYLVYEGQGKYQKAFDVLKQLDRVKQLLYSEQVEKRTVDMEVKYRVSQKEQRIKLQKAEIKVLNNQILIVILITIMVILTLGALFYFYKQVRAQRDKIESQRRKLDIQHKEFQHRTKNNFAMLSGIFQTMKEQSSNNNPAVVIDQIDQKLQALNLINNNLDQWATLNNNHFFMNLYLEELTYNTMLFHSIQHHQIKLDLLLEETVCSYDQMMLLGLVFNEVVTNAFKYAFPNTAHPALKIVLNQSDNATNLTVTDNGPGFNSNKITGSGKVLIGHLVDQLNGVFSYENTSTGVQFTLRF